MPLHNSSLCFQPPEQNYLLWSLRMKKYSLFRLLSKSIFRGTGVNLGGSGAVTPKHLVVDHIATCNPICISKDLIFFIIQHCYIVHTIYNKDKTKQNKQTNTLKRQFGAEKLYFNFATLQCVDPDSGKFTGMISVAVRCSPDADPKCKTGAERFSTEVPPPPPLTHTRAYCFHFV